jgi:exopolyphosphatase/guanosine-5'-triphosphate,3'-diphosphate pyrophosphatase
MDEATAALDRMLQIARGHGVTLVRAVATAAVRTASNGPEFVERLRTAIGLKVEVISGEHEAQLALLSALDGLALDGSVVVVDIGGGSVEIVRAVGRMITEVASVPLGAVVLSDRFGNTDPMPKADARGLKTYVRDTLAAALDADEPPAAVMVGSGGTVTTLAAILAAERDPDPVNVHGFVITREDLGGLRGRLVASSAREREAMRGMSASRVDLIVAGAVVLDEAVRALGAHSVLVNAWGMRAGIVIEAIERDRGAGRPVERMAAAREFAQSCNADAAHAQQVRRLALNLFDTLAEPLGIIVHDRPLLEAAAIVHDVGYLISYESHNKHSHHLISHAALPGFTADERRMIAAVARYHRGNLPKPRHEAMQGLSEKQVATVSMLASLLRIADGLDRSQAQRVDEVTAAVSAEEVRVVIEGESPLDAEIYGALHKADLFERTFGLPVSVVGRVNPVA